VALGSTNISMGAGTNRCSTVVDGLANIVVDWPQDGSYRACADEQSSLRVADDAIALATFQDLTEELWANEH